LTAEAEGTAKPTVALDGFGAERGFEVLADGARRAATEGIRLRVFGPPRELGLDGTEGVEVVATEEWIRNEEEPLPAVRSRPQASIVRACRDVAEGAAGAVATVGSTGAAMAAATFRLRRMQGVQRPALAVLLPVPGKPVLFLDVGANVEVRPAHLLQFAFLGAAFSEAVLGVSRPKVGLLTVGEESGKGTPAVVEAHGMLAAAEGIEFIGNVEGAGLPAGDADVVVTDGFTGNVALKLMEGTAKTVTRAIRDAARTNPLAAAGGLLMRPALGGLRRQLSPDTTGGAVLLGLRSPAVVGHGSSGPEGVANAVRLAARCVEQRAVERTAELLRCSRATRGELAERPQSAEQHVEA
jgi:glycerol-3-phosphate acyltransferase PlsX